VGNEGIKLSGLKRWNIVEMEQLIAPTKTALEAKRQDDESLALYWQCIQSDVEIGMLPEAYRLLYTAWSAQEKPDSLDALVEFACQRHLSDIETLAFIANNEFQAKRDENALKLYDRLLTLKAIDTKMYSNLKAACFRHQPFDDFINLLLQQCFSYDPDDLTIVRFLFSQYLLHERYTYTPFAPQIYQKILDIEPENLSARSVLSEYYYRQGKYDKAITEGKQGLQYDKHHVDLLAVLAKAYYERGEYGKVVTYCRNILARRPGRGEIQVLLAEVYTENALTTNDAIKAYRLALQYEPDHLPIRQALLRSYLRKLMIDDAIAEYERIVVALYEKYEPTSADFQSPIKGMIEEYERAIRRSPGDITLYLITAKLYEYIGHFNKALIYYRTLLQLPLDAKLLDELIEFLEKLATFRVQNPHLYLYLGLLYHQVQRYEDAKSAFRIAMYSDLDEREVDDILVKHDRSIWQYPPVLVILAHHRIVTKDILEGLVQTFHQSDHEDWEGALWVLQELYDVNDVVMELRQVFSWESFNEIYPQIIPIFANNGSRLAIQVLNELLSHSSEPVRLQALHALMEIEHPFADQCISEASRDNLYTDIRLDIVQYYAQHLTEQTTYHLMNMLHDEDRDVRLWVVQALRKRDIQAEYVREALFTEQDSEIRVEIIKILAQLEDPDEALYLAHLFNDLVARRHGESSRETGTAKVYSRLKKLIGYVEDTDEIKVLSTLIQALGNLRTEEGIHGLIIIASSDSSQLLRIEAIDALGRIGSPLGVIPLQTILHTSSESQDIRTAAEQALDLIIQKSELK
jgi:HEAT repeat protein/Flp pilus assembly protein TadD